MFLKNCLLLLSLSAVFCGACQKKEERLANGAIPATLAEVPAARLSFRYEADVPAPPDPSVLAEERSVAVQADFDQKRPQEILDKTVTSPDKKRILAVYHRAADMSSEYRLDMYSSEGALLRKITPDAMAAHFPDTIVWSPDSNSLAFVAMIRAGQDESGSAPVNPAITPADSIANTNSSPAAIDESSPTSNTEANSSAVPTPSAPTGLLALRTEQLYICNANGENTKALTQTDGLIYFFYAWSPDSTMLAALAVTSREWQVLQSSSDSKGEVFTPAGRLRVVEKNGRERRLDDMPTTVRPVWSPDSAKIAAAFGTQVRVYDANGLTPTQAAVQLRNQLLISSQAFDREEQNKLQNSNGAAPANQTAVQEDQSTTTVPDEKTLVSFNPIIQLNWTVDNILYLRTAYVRRMRNDADSVTSFARWHRVIFSYQPAGA